MIPFVERSARRGCCTVRGGGTAGQSIDAMAVVYMVTTQIRLLFALQFVNPTQIVTRGKH
jgi:hypothetical protein